MSEIKMQAARIHDYGGPEVLIIEQAASGAKKW